MKSSHWLAILGLASFLAAVPAARGQERVPHIGYAFPAGGQRGTTFTVTLGGEYLDGIRRARFSGGGIEATLVPQERIINFNEADEARKKLLELQKGKWDPEKQKQIAENQKKVRRYNVARLQKTSYPAIAEMATFRVTLAPNAEPGQRELRVETPRGLSNPLAFHVGRLPEFCETQPQPRIGGQFYQSIGAVPPKPEMRITLPVIVNGQIIPREPDMLYFLADRFTPGDVDRYHFQARKGQQLVFTASARALIPYLADAVPGWFQATLALYDAQGKEVAYDDDYRFHPDPVLFYKVPADGKYTLEIKDAIYRGRPDFVYRIAAGELPFVSSIFPLGGRAGEQTTVALAGWNLPTQKLTMDAKDKVPGIYPLSVSKDEMTSNTVPFAVDTLPECLEKEPNDSLQTAQPVQLPVIVNGRIDRPGDWDVFRFEGRAGEQVIAEVYARRLDSPLDSVLELTDAAGKRLAFNDDHEDKGDGLNTHHADSLIAFTLPADGSYYLRLGDAQHEGGPEYAYRLRISPPQPDFALRVAPSAINGVPGMSAAFSVFALRKDGFAGDIDLRLKDAPRGFSLAGGQVPAGQDQLRLTLLIPPWASTDPVGLRIEGRSTIAGREVVHAAVPADDMMQAFAYRHLVPAKDLQVFAAGGWPRNQGPAGRGPGGNARWRSAAAAGSFRSPVTLLGQQPLKIPAGGTATVQFGMSPKNVRGEVQLELNDPPQGIAVDRVSQGETGVSIVVHDDAEKAKPGLKGNLIATAYQKTTFTDKEKKTHEVRTLMGNLPAIPFEVVK